MSWLLEADPITNDPFKEHMWLVGDARLIIVAGSDTTAATLTHMFYHIARDPIIAARLREEVKPLVAEDGSFDIKALANADYLNGVINETLRLHPPVPSGLSRLTPPEGITIGKTRVPGDTIVSVPLWTAGRCKFASPPPTPIHTHTQTANCSRSRLTPKPQNSTQSLAPTARLHPRAVVQPAGPDPEQERVRALFYRPLRLHRQEPGAHGAAHRRRAAGDEVRRRLCPWRGRPRPAERDGGLLYDWAGAAESAVQSALRSGKGKGGRGM